MRDYHDSIAGQSVVVRQVETEADLAAFDLWLISAGPVLAFDTETTGLGIFRSDFACRRVQVGDASTAWVFDPVAHARTIRRALSCRTLVAHNAPFDLLVLDRAGLLDLDDGLARTIDTRLLAHILDPRDRSDGALGHGLKELSQAYVDRDAADSQHELKAVFRALKSTIAVGWSVVDANDPVYVRYAGYDVLLAHRLYTELSKRIMAAGMAALVGFEHRVQAVCARMMRRGVLLDVPYTNHLIARLHSEENEAKAAAAALGLANVNAPRQVAAVLMDQGWKPKGLTKTGQPKVDKDVLEGCGIPVAAHVLAAKRASKRRTSYAESMLNGRDSGDRVHCWISSLQARTARMSISAPPLQQLPSREWSIRRALIADEGQQLISVDYKAVELRVLAALANVKEMKRAIRENRDLHDFTASLVFGADFTPDQRKIAKTVGLGRVYGGGAETLARQSGAPIAQIRSTLEEYGRVYPEVSRYSRELMTIAERDGAVTTPSGRRLPVDEDRRYAGLNYVAQSTARDILARALIRLEQQGLGGYLLLPVHDEVVAQAPKDEAEIIGKEIAEVMRDELMGVAIDTDVDLALHRSWGSLPDYQKHMPEGEWLG